MNRLCVALFCFFVSLALCVLVFREDRPKPIYIEDVAPTPASYVHNPADIAVVNEINRRNAEVKTYQTDIRCEVQHKAFARVSGDLAYQKPHNSRLRFDSLFGREADLGSNESHFWFWSRQMRPRGLYFAKHEDLYKTRLKAGLHPMWMMKGLNLDAIDLNGVSMEDYKGKLLLRQRDRGINGEPVTKLTLIDRERHLVVGNYLYDANDGLISSMEVSEFDTWLPKTLYVVWHDPSGQRVALRWQLSNQRVNAAVPAERFRMPDYSPRVDMGVD